MYRVWYRTVKELSEDNHPRLRKGHPEQIVRPKSVAFLVHKDIPLVDWDIIMYDDENGDLMATLVLQTNVGKIAFHNVYNRNNKLNIDTMMDCIFGNGADVIMIDSNLHHSTWCGANFPEDKIETKARKLANVTRAADMGLLTVPGTITYKRSSKDDGKYESTIDLQFGGPAIQSRMVNCGPVPEGVRGFESDHLPQQGELNVKPNRQPYYDLRRAATSPEILKAMEAAIVGMELPPLNDFFEVDQFAQELRDRMIKAQSAVKDQWVPDVERQRTTVAESRGINFRRLIEKAGKLFRYLQCF